MRDGAGSAERSDAAQHLRPEDTTSNTYYDACADSYSERLDDSVDCRLQADALSRHVGPADRVLEVGCANGRFLFPTANLCAEIVGVDVSDRMLEVCRGRVSRFGLTNARLYLQSATELKFEKDSFDLVYSFSTLLLVRDASAAIGEIARVLRPGGIAVLDLTGRYNLSARYFARWYRGQGHFGVRSFSRAESQRVLEQSGLAIIEECATGVLDQWKYLPLLHRVTLLERCFHLPSFRWDPDVWLSNLPGIRAFANRWLYVCRKLPSL